MSETNNSEEKDKQVVISAEDCMGALDFWTHFDIEPPAELKQAMDKFIANPTFDNQNLVKLEICKTIATSDHEAFKDDMFQKIVDECRSTAYEMSFDKEVEETFSVKTQEKPE